MKTPCKSRRRVLSVSSAVLCLWALAAIGCQGGGSKLRKATAEEAEPISSGTIVAAMHRYVESGSSEPFERFTITALFPRYRPAAAALVEGLVGERVPELFVAPDQCVAPQPIVKQKPPRLSAVEGTAIELADVGDLSVECDGVKTTLPTQTFPDLLRVVDGVTYAADEEMGALFSPAETYTIHAAGTDEIARFDVVLDAPEDLGEITVNGVSPAEQMPVVRRGEPLVITWEGAGGYGDEVIAKVSLSNMGMPLAVECRMRDDGEFTVPREMTVGLRDPLAAGEAEMTLSRVRQTSFRAKGLDSGEFAFALSTSFLVRFETVP